MILKTAAHFCGMNTLSKLGIFTLLFISSLTIMVGSAIAPALSGIIEATDFNFPPSLLITLPALGVLVFAHLIGKLTNVLGPFKLLALGLIPYAVLGVIGAYLGNQYLLLIDRFLLGAATVAIQVSVTGLIAQLFSGSTRMKIIAWQGMAIELGGVVFLSIGGILGEWHWQAPFYIYLIALFCLFLLYNTIPKNAPTDAEQTRETQHKPTSQKIIWAICAASLAAMVLFFVSFVTLPLYLDQRFDFSESIIGYYMAFISLMAIAIASQMPKVVNKFGDAKTVAIGFLFFCFGYVVFAATHQILFLILAAIFIGIGFGLTVPLLNHMTVEASTPETRGKNLGRYSMGIFGGQFLSTFITFISTDYITIYWVAAAFGILVCMILFILFKKVLNT